MLHSQELIIPPAKLHLPVPGIFPGRLLLIFGLILLVLLAPPVPARAEETVGYSDLEGHWAKGTIELMSRIEVVTGYPDNSFRPDVPITRLDFTVFAVRAMGLTLPAQPQLAFRDAAKIPTDYHGHIAAALEAGLINGFPDNTFRPAEAINRVQMATILGRALRPLGLTVETRWFYLFQDRESIPSWAEEASIAVKTRIVTGRVYFRVFAPLDPTTRAEAATMLYRFMEKRSELLPDVLHPGTVSQNEKYLVGGYYWARDINPGRPYETLTTYGRFIDLAILPSYSMKADGTFTSDSYDSQLLFDWGRQNDRKILALVKNEEFSREVARGILNDAPQTAVEQIYQLMQKGYDGVNIDFENVDKADRQAYSRFVRLLSARLRPAGYLVTLSVPAKTWDNPDHGWSGAFDYAALAPWVDYLVPMAYDEHWSTSIPGPVASYLWMERVIKYTISVVPRNKVILGLPVYGYDWPVVNSGPQPAARALSALKAVEQAKEFGVAITWDDGSKTPYYYYTRDGQRRVVHFSNERSLEFQLILVRDHRLAGVIFWRLGFEVPEIWPVVARDLKTPQGE